MTSDYEAGHALLTSGSSSAGAGGSIYVSAASSGDANISTSHGSVDGDSGRLTVWSGSATAAAKTSGALSLTAGRSSTMSGMVAMRCGLSTGAQGTIMSVTTGVTSDLAGGTLCAVTGTSTTGATGDASIKSPAASEATGPLRVGSGATSSDRTGAVLVETAASLGAGNVECVVKKVGGIVARGGNTTGTSAVAGKVSISSSGASTARSGSAQILSGTGSAGAGAASATSGPCADATTKTGAADTSTGALTIHTGASATDASARLVVKTGSGGNITMTGGGGTEAAACLFSAGVATAGGGGGVVCTSGSLTTGSDAAGIRAAGGTAGGTISVASGAAASSSGVGSLAVATGSASGPVGTLSIEADPAAVGAGSAISISAGTGALGSGLIVTSGEASSDPGGNVSLAAVPGSASTSSGFVTVSTGRTISSASGAVELATGTSEGDGDAAAVASRDLYACAAGDVALSASGILTMKVDETSAEAYVGDGRVDLVAGALGEIGLIASMEGIGFGSSKASVLRLTSDDSGDKSFYSDVTAILPDQVVDSDQRIKSNLVAANVDDIHRRLNKVGLQTYGYADTWCSVHACSDALVRGLIAQELRHVFPEHVSVVPSYSIPGTDLKLEQFHQVNKLSLALDSIAGLQAQAGRFRVESGGQGVSSTLRLRSDNHAGSGSISLATGAASDESSGGVAICSGAAQSSAFGGSIALLTQEGALSAGGVALCAGAGRRALTISASGRQLLSTGNGVHGGQFSLAASNCHVVLGSAPAGVASASLSLASGYGGSACGGAVVCASGSSSTQAAGAAMFGAGQSPAAGGGVALSAGSGQKSSRPVDLLAGDIILGTAPATGQTGALNLRTSQAESSSGAVRMMSHQSREAAGSVTLRSGRGRLNPRSAQVALRGEGVCEICSQRANTVFTAGRAKAPANSIGGSLSFQTSASEAGSIIIEGQSQSLRSAVAFHTGGSKDADAAGKAIITAGETGGRIVIKSNGAKHSQGGDMWIASRPATASSSGSLDLASGAGGQAAMGGRGGALRWLVTRCRRKRRRRSCWV